MLGGHQAQPNIRWTWNRRGTSRPTSDSAPVVERLLERAQGDFYTHRASAADEIDGRLGSALKRPNLCGEVRAPGNRDAVDTCDDIAGLEARSCSRSARNDRLDV